MRGLTNGHSTSTETQVPGSASMEIDANVKGSIPYAKTLVLAFPITPFDRKGGMTLGISESGQWWSPGRRLKIKVFNKP